MSARAEIELALAKHCRRAPESSAVRLLAQYDAEVLAAPRDRVRRALELLMSGQGMECAYLLDEIAGEKSSREADCTPTNFFQPGRTYQHSAWFFRCAAVAAHPASGEHTAIGWLCFRKSEWTAYSYTAAEWGDGWTDVTEGGGH